MADLLYLGLPEFGLPLVTPEEPSFASLVRDIASRPGPGPSPPAAASDRAAVLLNQSGKAIIALEFVWRYVSQEGQSRTSRFSNLASSAQREVLAGRAKAERDLGTFILPQSKRLITEQGIFGNNLDVLTPDELVHPRGHVGAWASGGGVRGEAKQEFARVELILDLAILEDGLCVGPNESGLFEALREGLEIQRSTAQEALAELRSGASEGRIFELLRPLARQDRRAGSDERKSTQVNFFLQTFGREAIHHLINASGPELLAWFESAAQPPGLQLRRP